MMFFSPAKLHMSVCRVQLCDTAGIINVTFSNNIMPSSTYLNDQCKYCTVQRITIETIILLQCRLSDFDRRTPLDDFKPIELVDAPVRYKLLFIIVRHPLNHIDYDFKSQGIDYFENLCLQTETTCADQRTFSPPRVTVIFLIIIVINPIIDHNLCDWSGWGARLQDRSACQCPLLH